MCAASLVVHPTAAGAYPYPGACIWPALTSGSLLGQPLLTGPPYHNGYINGEIPRGFSTLSAYGHAYPNLQFACSRRKDHETTRYY